MAADDQDDPFAETAPGPTPAGGVASTIYYLDDSGQPVRKSKATRAEIVEVDREGNTIRLTYLEINRK